jgi:nitroreductase
MELREAIYGRRAVRAYTAEPVPEELIRRLLDCAVQAPSAMNEQPWAFAIVEGAPLLDRLAARAKAYVLDTMPADGPLAQLRSAITEPDYHLFHHAAALIVLCARFDGPFVATDCALAAQNLMLAAHDLGLGTCWIGLARDWLGLPGVKAELGIPADHSPIAPIVVGKPAGPTAAHGHEPPRVVAWKR